MCIRFPVHQEIDLIFCIVWQYAFYFILIKQHAQKRSHFYISFEYFEVINILFCKEDYLIYNFVLGLSWI